MFKIYNCDFGFKINSTKYDFEHVDSVGIEDPERNQLTRGANAKNKTGLAYKDGLKEPKRWTIPILDMSPALKDVMESAYDNQTRMDVYCIDRQNGSSKFLNQALLSNRPQQLTLDETPESMQVSLEFISFDTKEVLK